MAELVIDASLASAWCFPDERTDYSNGVLQTISSSMEAFAPRLWAYEVRNSVLMGLRRGRITKGDADDFLASLETSTFGSPTPFRTNLFALAERTGLPVCDASYLDLAIREGSQLASLDDAMCRVAVREGIRVFEIPKKKSDD